MHICMYVCACVCVTVRARPRLCGWGVYMCVHIGICTVYVCGHRSVTWGTICHIDQKDKCSINMFIFNHSKLLVNVNCDIKVLMYCILQDMMSNGIFVRVSALVRSLNMSASLWVWHICCVRKPDELWPTDWWVA